MARSEQDYKKLTIREFTKAAEVYDGSHAGIYEMCREDYPPVLAELEKEPFTDLLDCGCGTGPMIELLHSRCPEKHYTGLDITPEMIRKAQAKQLPHAAFVVGDCENLPFAPGAFDVVICTNSFHHYPNPQAFFDSVYRVLRPGGRLILRDYTSSDFLVWLMNHVELPLARLCGHGDVRVYRQSEYRAMLTQAGLVPVTLEAQKNFRIHVVARKAAGKGCVPCR